MLIKHLHFITIIEHECLIIRRLVSRQFMVWHTNYKMSSNVSGIFHIVGLKIQISQMQSNIHKAVSWYWKSLVDKPVSSSFNYSASVLLPSLLCGSCLLLALSPLLMVLSPSDEVAPSISNLYLCYLQLLLIQDIGLGGLLLVNIPSTVPLKFSSSSDLSELNYYSSKKYPEKILFCSLNHQNHRVNPKFLCVHTEKT